jgi:hypothetical protein
MSACLSNASTAHVSAQSTFERTIAAAHAHIRIYGVYYTRRLPPAHLHAKASASALTGRTSNSDTGRRCMQEGAVTSCQGLCISVPRRESPRLAMKKPASGGPSPCTRTLRQLYGCYAWRISPAAARRAAYSASAAPQQARHRHNFVSAKRGPLAAALAHVSSQC